MLELKIALLMRAGIVRRSGDVKSCNRRLGVATLDMDTEPRRHPKTFNIPMLLERNLI